MHYVHLSDLKKVVSLAYSGLNTSIDLDVIIYPGKTLRKQRGTCKLKAN